MAKLIKYTARLRFIKRPRTVDNETLVGKYNIILQQLVQEITQMKNKERVSREYWRDVPFYDSEFQANVAHTPHSIPERHQ